MAKKGMKRMERTHTQPKNEAAAVSQLQGKARLSNEKANPIIAGTKAPSLKVYHAKPFEHERPVLSFYRGLYNDLGRDNLENDIPAADLQDL